MDGIEQLPAQYQQFAGIIFAVVVAIGSAIVFLRGRREGSPQPKVQEFYASGSLADMGPVKELVAQTGLLVQQQVRTNVVLERLAVVAEGAIEEQKKERDDRELEEEREKLKRELMEDIRREAEMADRQREAEADERRPPRKTT